MEKKTLFFHLKYKNRGGPGGWWGAGVPGSRLVFAHHLSGLGLHAMPGLHFP